MIYDLLLQLPVFLGLSHDQFTAILEKIPFRFDRVSAGAILSNMGEPARQVTFVLSGKVRLKSFTYADRITIDQQFRGPAMMPFASLFGTYTTLTDTVVAESDVSVLYIEKDHFFQLIQCNPIVLLNVMNLLSSQVQKHARSLSSLGEKEPVHRLAGWILYNTSQYASEIIIDARIADLCELQQFDQSTFWKCVAELEKHHCIEITNRRLKVTDRYALRSIAAHLV